MAEAMPPGIATSAVVSPADGSAFSGFVGQTPQAVQHRSLRHGSGVAIIAAARISMFHAGTRAGLAVRAQEKIGRAHV